MILINWLHVTRRQVKFLLMIFSLKSKRVQVHN